MNQKTFPFPKQIIQVVWQILYLILPVIVFSLVLTEASPSLLRPLSMALRISFGVVMLITTLVLYIIFRIPGQIGELFIFIAIMLLFALGLAGVWASGVTQSIMINGLIPVSDATAYYIDALRILHGLDISDFSAMRPLFPGFFSVVLWLTQHNLMIALAVITAIAGVSAYFASREIRQTHGPETATVFLMLVFLYFRHHSGTTMSESFSVPIGLLGIALLWQGISTKKEWRVLAGIAMVTLALNIRPGAMFVLPALLIWGGLFFHNDKRFSLQFFLIGVVLILFVFLLNNLMIKELAGPNAAAFSNFSWALYGLTSGGKSWTFIFEAHPEIAGLNPTEQSRTVYILALQQFMQHPNLALEGALKYWRFFFSSTWYNAYAFVAGSNYWVNEAARYGMYLLSGLGIIKWWRNRSDPYTSLALFGAIGVLASVPFVPPTDAYRVRLYAATIPFFILLPAMGISFLIGFLPAHFFGKIAPNHQLIEMPIFFSAALTVVMIVSPLALQANGSIPQVNKHQCPQDLTPIVVQFDAGTYINIKRENIAFLDRMPDFHMSVFRNNIHDLADNRLTNKLAAINPPATLFYSLDFLSNLEVFVVIDTPLLPSPGTLLSLCGVREKDQSANYNLFYVYETAH